MTLTSLIYVYTVLVLAGFGMASLLYFWHKRRVRGKIVCYFFGRTRQLYSKLLRPDPLGAITVKQTKKSYVYREENILYTVYRFLFIIRDPVPCLIFNEDKPEPINVFRYAPKRLMVDEENDASATELSQILDDKSVTDFVQAQSKVKLGQVMQAIIVSMIVVIGTVGVSAWYILRKISEVGG